MTKKPSSCLGCPLYTIGRGFARPEGKAKKKLLVVAEALGENEARDSLPLRPYAQAGSIFERALMALRLSRDDVVIQNIVNCFPGDTLVEATGIEKAYKRWYEGPLVRVKTKSGVLTGTPNHPVLTKAGMVPLGSLNKGMHLARSGFSKGICTTNPNVNKTPTHFEELFSTLAKSFVGERIIDSAMNFHGDGANSEVNIISSNRKLWVNQQSSTAQHSSKFCFVLSNELLSSLVGYGSSLNSGRDLCLRMGSSSSSFVGGFGKGYPNFSRGSQHSKLLGLANTADMNSVLLEGTFKPTLPNVEFFTKGFDTFPKIVSFDEILQIEKLSSFSGHVYNLQTVSHQYTANGYIVSNCQPPGNVLEGASYKYHAISHCKSNLDYVVEEYKPTAILALGGVALEALTGMKGRKKNISSLRGYVLWTDTYKLPLIATYHPAFLARGKKELLGVFYYDIRRAVKLAQGELVEGRDYYLDPMRDYPNSYNLSATEEDWWVAYEQLKSNPDLPIAFDLETADSIAEESEDDIEHKETVVTQFQLSIRKGHAMVADRKGSYLSEKKFFGLISNFMSLPNPKLSWNGWRFDQPVLESYGVTIQEPHYDLMTMFHHSEPDLPAGLQFAASMFGFTHPWKHLSGGDLPWYGATDVDVLHWIYESLKEKMKKEGTYGE